MASGQSSLKEGNMPKVIITAHVQDPVKWEANFKTHGDVFKTYGLGAPVHYAVTGSEVTLCMEPKNLDSFMKAMQAKQTVDAMALDGVKRETVKVVPLNKELKV
jgi:hypothetical protein